ncbi:hypothetical protein SAMN04487949_3100 [Halogranum gelatinilyticum]|uniref:Uncharacterized protein n=1 Tax=Halogranum gelatinilyticum TaxID=660521 RepID=A0A1G9XSY4_9EURY|nr:hypothetical protein [Halogranum gelatinilyticum]SDM99373.1 hypothetical protein SAMN04487949_3100 [Halogranum gelatinilyticum]
MVHPLSARGQLAASRVMQLAIVGILLVGLWTRNVAVVVNAALSLAVTVLPAVLERDWDIPLDAGLTLWLTTAVLLHAIGMLGLYSSVPWWDHLTHTLSATVVAAVGYTTARAIDEHSDAVYFPPRFLFVYVLLFTLALGVFWEVLEFAVHGLSDVVGIDAVLVQYSLEDTLVDLVFDAVGAVLVSLFGTTTLRSAVDTLTARLAGSSTDESR